MPSLDPQPVRLAPVDSTFVSGQAGSSGDLSLVSSVANQAIRVFAISLDYGGSIGASTDVTALLQDGSGGLELFRYRCGYDAAASGFQVSGPVHLAITPPNYLFRTSASGNLNLRGTSSGTIYSLSYWTE